MSFRTPRKYGAPLGLSLSVVVCASSGCEPKVVAAHEKESFANPPELRKGPLQDGAEGFSIEIRPAVRVFDGRRRDGASCFEHCLRSYQDRFATEPNLTAVGPTMRIRAGDAKNCEQRRVRFDLSNELVNPDPHAIRGRYVYDFNATNFHTHGLHISPVAAPAVPTPGMPRYWADNVLIDLCPKNCYPVDPDVPKPFCDVHPGCSAYGPGDVPPTWDRFAYRFDIDEFGVPMGEGHPPGCRRHEPGTFWYHAHKHGATAMQLANGMAGALIVEDEIDADICRIVRGDEAEECEGREPTWEGYERVWMLQQIPYNDDNHQCSAPDEAIDCSPQNNDDLTINDDDLQPLLTIATPTIVNGQILPVLEMTMNRAERWRLIHGGVAQGLQLELRPGFPLLDAENEPILDEYDRPLRECDPSRVSEKINQPRIEFHRIAIDGLMLDESMDTERIELQPGYRVDVLVEVTEDEAECEGPDCLGLYCLYDVAVGGRELGEHENSSLVARVHVVNDPKSEPSLNADTLDRVDQQLAKQRARHPTIDCNDPAVVASPDPSRPDLRTFDVQFQQGDLPTLVEPATWFPPAPVATPQCTEPRGNGANQKNMNVNGLLFSHHATSRCLPLEQSEEWRLRAGPIANGGGTVRPRDPNHPFHIHTNPFTLCPVVPNTSADPLLDTPHWRDTWLVREGWPEPQPGSGIGPREYKIRQAYDDYTGQFVMHCHILPHEDQGMMMLLDVRPAAECDDAAALPERLRCCSEGDLDPACCRWRGEACTSHNECCSGTCDGGLCRSEIGYPCENPEDQPDLPSQCAQPAADSGLPANECEGNRCCLGAGGICTDATQCCNGASCAAIPTVPGSPSICCAPEGSACGEQAEGLVCCSGDPCPANGICPGAAADGGGGGNGGGGGGNGGGGGGSAPH